jgi:hypothetical protein
MPRRKFNYQSRIGAVCPAALDDKELCAELLRALRSIDPLEARALAANHAPAPDYATMRDDLIGDLHFHAPPYFWFGLSADRAEYGWWFGESLWADGLHDGDLVTCSDHGKIRATAKAKANPDAFWVAVVNDHGNVSLYSAGKCRGARGRLPKPLWEIV